MSKIPKISGSEWEVMNVIWEKSPISTSEVMTRLSHKSWKITTVKTFLDRLVQKRVLGFEMHGGRYSYIPKVSKEACVKCESRSFLSRVFNGETAPMLMQFVKNADLSLEEIQELKQILRKKEAEREHS